ncbi:MAG: hypothetical protein MUO24_07300 [Desulfobacterales bacterium]|nr:hypothetical protein [Desulfobacterales bacterium]
MEQMKEQGDRYCRDWERWWHKDRRRRSRIGIFLIIIGGLWLGGKLGFFNPAIFWPLTFIAIGIWIVVSCQRATGQRATFGSGSLLRGKSGNPSK